MECPGCGVDNPTGSAFCRECGRAFAAGEAEQNLPGFPFPVIPYEASPEPSAAPACGAEAEAQTYQIPPGAPAYLVTPGAPPYQPPPGVSHQGVAKEPTAQQPVYQPLFLTAQPVYVGPRSDGLCIAGMVLGIVGLVFFWVPFLPLPCGILGMVFGGIGTRNVQQKPGEFTGGGMGVAGLVTGILAVIGGIIMLVVYLTSS